VKGGANTKGIVGKQLGETEAVKGGQKPVEFLGSRKSGISHKATMAVGGEVGKIFNVVLLVENFLVDILAAVGKRFNPNGGEEDNAGGCFGRIGRWEIVVLVESGMAETTVIAVQLNADA